MNDPTAASAADVDAVGAGDTPPVVVGEAVRKSYGDVVALDGVDLRVEPGEVFGLIGPNGAGKTTLVRALTGTTPVEGTVRVFGVPPAAVNSGRVGLLPQSFDPPERLTARELVDYYGGLYDDARDTETVLRDVGMADDADVWYETLSGGQRRRTCVATAIVNDPDVLFLDEPTTGIDPAGRRSIHRLIERLAAGGTTVFLTSHAMDEVERLADRVALLRDGRVVAVGPPADLIGDHGGRARLDVALDGPATDAAVDAVASALARPPTGTTDDPAVETTGDGLRVFGVRPERIGSVVDAIRGVDVGFESLAWTEPSLENVYLRLTGEAYSPRGTGNGTGRRAGEVAEADPTDLGPDVDAGSADAGRSR